MGQIADGRSAMPLARSRALYAAGWGLGRRVVWALALLSCLFVAGSGQVFAQTTDPLNEVHVQPPAARHEADKPAEAGTKTELPTKTEPLKAGLARPVEGTTLRVDVSLTLIPVVVTDPLNRLVTGLEKNNFYLFEKSEGKQEELQQIKTFSTEDAPVSIGLILDLSGSMSSKFDRARAAVHQFLKTANPADEFFVVGFNDRPDLMVDFTSSVEDVDTRLAMTKPSKRTALLDAIYFGVNKMKDAKYARKALLIVSDGGDNRSRYTESELRAIVRESDVQIYAMGIFDEYAPTTEERLGPLLLDDICSDTGGRMFRVNDINDMAEVAAKISDELRDEYVLGYRSSDMRRDGKWRKVKVRLDPPPGLPQLTVHARSGYYAPSL
jgi:Ca-activated chloride channel family protein